MWLLVELVGGLDGVDSVAGWGVGRRGGSSAGVAHSERLSVDVGEVVVVVDASSADSVVIE